MEVILTKVCFKCNEKKPITEFYKHKQMSLGVVNKCKVCNKLDVKNDYYKKSTDLIWVEKERQRSKEKYYRLNYKESQKIWDENKPWKKEAILKNLNKKLNIEKGFECHHWSYNPEHFEDVFIIEKKEHRKAHTFLKFNFYTKKFNDLNDNCLYSKIAHLNYLMQKGINVKIIN